MPRQMRSAYRLPNLDARIRLTVRHEIRALQKRLGITAVHVTHDREEAMVMADRIVVLDKGRIEQAGTPEELYHRPISAFVATFLGADNVIRLDVEHQGSDTVLSGAGIVGQALVPRLSTAAGATGSVHAHFRSEAAELRPPDSSAEPSCVDFPGIVRHASYPGGIWRHAVSVAGTEVLVDSKTRHQPGAAVHIRVPKDALFIFPAGSAN